ncbi:hypothetical protein KUCAC02_035162 [Chaenocephalus aceratus]|nr:hypothetical protein KUCAC02_035162 [Chaenocephalus aceratus]
MGQKISGSIKSVDVRGEPSYRPVRRELRGPDFCRPPRLDLLLDMPPASLETQLHHSWNPDDRSLNVFVKEDDKLTFSPAPRGSEHRLYPGEKWLPLGGFTFGGSTGRADREGRTRLWAWPPLKRRYTRWATRRWWERTPSPGAGTWAENRLYHDGKNRPRFHAAPTYPWLPGARRVLRASRLADGDTGYGRGNAELHGGRTISGSSVQRT